MQIQYTDYNDADQVIASSYQAQWLSILSVLEEMPLHLKASDQAGIQGSPIFDPVGTNEHVKREMCALPGWGGNIRLPSEYSFLGTDVDLGNSGVIAEVQFSNYPFLLNNTFRCEILFKARSDFTGAATGLIIIITKAKMFPASNSTLYYEQGQHQLGALVNLDVFEVPIRLVGLFEDEDGTVPCLFTEYSATRYSREVSSRSNKQCEIKPGRTSRSRCILRVF